MYEAYCSIQTTDLSNYKLIKKYVIRPEYEKNISFILR